MCNNVVSDVNESTSLPRSVVQDQENMKRLQENSITENYQELHSKSNTSLDYAGSG